jgi:phycocyanobilin lyase subunit beta
MTNSACASELIRAVEQADSPTRLLAAVRALAEARLEAGIPKLIAVLGYNNPEVAAAAVEGLVQLGEVAVPSIVEQLDDYNYGARAYSFRALAAIGDPRALNTLLSAAETDFAPSVRRAAAKGLGNLRWVQLPAAQRQLAQEQVLKTLLSLCDDPEWAIRYAAVVGLQALAAADPPTAPDLVSQILTRFEQIADAEAELAVRARVWLAQQQLQATS